MATNQGTVTFDFGAAPGTNVVSTVVADAAIGAASNIEIYLTGLDSTADHNAYEHGLLAMLAPLQMTPISRTASVGFTGQMATQLRLTGTFKARYVWAD
jgi:hypothetical protein